MTLVDVGLDDSRHGLPRFRANPVEEPVLTADASGAGQRTTPGAGGYRSCTTSRRSS